MTKRANYHVSLKCFLKNKDWQTLILKTTEDSSFNWMYDFPGWRIDEDEFEVDYIDILKREILEEIWVSKVLIKKNVVAIWRHKVLSKFRKTSNEDGYIFYLFFEWFLEESQELIISHEHNDFEWVYLENIKLEDYFYSWLLEWPKMYLSK